VYRTQPIDSGVRGSAAILVIAAHVVVIYAIAMTLGVVPAPAIGRHARVHGQPPKSCHPIGSPTPQSPARPFISRCRPCRQPSWTLHGTGPDPLRANHRG
jgi:hypothetical protein